MMLRLIPAALALLAAVLFACCSDRESRQSGSSTRHQGTESSDRRDSVETGRSAEPPISNPTTPVDADFLAPGTGDLADHRPTGPEDREVLTQVYLSFIEDPEDFVTRVEQFDSGRQGRIVGYLLCAAGKLHAAGQSGQAGAPIQITLPPEAKQLIGFQGSPERARVTFLRQLAGEFLIVGRSIQSINRGDKAKVEQILRRQKQNLEMMKVAHGPAKAAEWSATIRRVFPVLFTTLLPEC